MLKTTYKDVKNSVFSKSVLMKDLALEIVYQVQFILKFQLIK